MSTFDADFAAFLDSAAGDLDKAPSKNTTPEFQRKKFKCEACHGTGKWRGGINRHGNAKCNVCHGNGSLVTSPEARQKARDQAASKKRRDAKFAQEQNAAHGNGFLLNWLTEVSTWNNFAAEMISLHNSGKEWTEKQVEACRRMYAKQLERDKQRSEEKAKQKAAATVVDLSPIKAMFEAAKAHGYKSPKYRAEGLTIKLAPSHGVNAGHLYVTTEEDIYMGKITPDMRYLGSRESKGAGIDELLIAIASDPLGAAVRYGNRTGRCACCGRPLSNDESITRGIGPICAERWGLLDMKSAATKEEAKAELNQLKAKILPPPPPPRR